MATKRPICHYSGLLQELSEGDTISRALFLFEGGVGISFEETIKPADGGVYNVLLPYGMVIPADASSSLFYNKTNPTATALVSIEDDGTEIVTLSVSTAGVATWATTSGTLKTVAENSMLSFIFPAQDSTWAGVVITLKGIRS